MREFERKAREAVQVERVKDIESFMSGAMWADQEHEALSRSVEKLKQSILRSLSELVVIEEERRSQILQLIDKLRG